MLIKPLDRYHSPDRCKPQRGSETCTFGERGWSLRSLFVGMLMTLAVASSSTSALSQETEPQEQPPNIVMIISDDQAWTDYSFMGHEQIRTPHLDRLAKQSVLFRRGYVPTALCRPSLLTMITGQYAHQHGVTGNDPSPKHAAAGTKLNSDRRAKLISYIDSQETIPKLLAKQGYACHQSGKWWEGSFQRGGFTHGMTRGFPLKGGRHGDDGLKIGRKGMEPVTEFIDEAVENEQPFFLWYAPFLPHSPHNPPQRLLDRHLAGDSGLPETFAKYFSMCEWFDETCGQLIEHLEDRKQIDNTLIVYVCDNGWIQNPNDKRFAPRSKQSPFEGGVRTPIMFSWPGKIAPADRSELCSSIDLMPTILAAAQVDCPKALPGLNLLPNLESQQPIDREAIFGESFAHDIADIENPEASLLFRWCIEGDKKLLLTYDGEANRYKSKHPRNELGPQLFDLSADPHEKENIAEANSEIVARLAKRLDDWYHVESRKVLTK